MKLAALQQVFWKSVRTQPGPPELASVFVSRGALTAQQRLGIYRTAYWVRQVDALRELFPSVAAALGDGPFARTASHYVRDCPSQHWALEGLADGFPAWLAGREEGRALADGASKDRLRWAAFVAPDARLLRREDLDGVALEGLRLRVAPHVKATRLPAGAEAWVAWREGFTVHEAPLPLRELHALEAAREGLAFDEFCGRVVDPALPAEQQPHAALACLLRWLARGWLLRTDEVT